MTKKDLTEQEIRTRYITPALRQAGWPLEQIREEHYLTAGQILPRGRKALRGKRKFADYVLYHHNLPLAIVELTNVSEQSRAVRIRSVCTKPRVEGKPIDRHGYGVHVTSGQLQWVGYNEPNHALVTALEDWNRQRNEPARTLLCTIGGDREPLKIEALQADGNPAEYEQRLTDIFEEIITNPQVRLVQ